MHSSYPTEVYAALDIALWFIWQLVQATFRCGDRARLLDSDRRVGQLAARVRHRILGILWRSCGLELA